MRAPSPFRRLYKLGRDAAAAASDERCSCRKGEVSPLSQVNKQNFPRRESAPAEY